MQDPFGEEVVDSTACSRRAVDNTEASQLPLIWRVACVRVWVLGFTRVQGGTCRADARTVSRKENLQMALQNKYFQFQSEACIGVANFEFGPFD